MERAASKQRLKKAFSAIFEETRDHAEWLEGVFGALGKDAKSKRCETMNGLLEEARDISEERGPGDIPETIRDAALISATRRIEHYKTSRYGTARRYAEELGLVGAANELDALLEEEKQTDETLNTIALGGWLSEEANVEERL